jgi:hypothetical protein
MQNGLIEILARLRIALSVFVFAKDGTQIDIRRTGLPYCGEPESINADEAMRVTRSWYRRGGSFRLELRFTFGTQLIAGELHWILFLLSSDRS